MGTVRARLYEPVDVRGHRVGQQDGVHHALRHAAPEADSGDEHANELVGGPGNDTWVAAWYTYRVSFQPPFQIGLGAASAYVIALIVGIIAIAYVRFVYRRVEY